MLPRATDLTMPEQVRLLGLFLTGRKDPESWKTDDRDSDLFDLKSVCQNLLIRMGISIRDLTYKEKAPGFMEQGFTYFHGRDELLKTGIVSAGVLRAFDIRQTVYYGELNMDTIHGLITGGLVRYTEIPRFPEVRRDLALLLDKAIPYSEVEKIAFETERSLLRRVNLFDVYEGKNIEAGKKSYAVSFYLQDEEKTLTDKVIEKVMNKLIGAYTNRLSATIR